MAETRWGMAETVFLFDVDTTLLDNDRIQADLRAHLAEAYGAATRDRYWAILEQLRGELGYEEYLSAFERCRWQDIQQRNQLSMAVLLVDYPFFRHHTSIA